MIHMARDVGNIDVGGVLQQLVEISTVFARGRHADLLVYSGSK